MMGEEIQIPDSPKLPSRLTPSSLRVLARDWNAYALEIERLVVGGALDIPEYKMATFRMVASALIQRIRDSRKRVVEVGRVAEKTVQVQFLNRTIVDRELFQDIIGAVELCDNLLDKSKKHLVLDAPGKGVEELVALIRHHREQDAEFLEGKQDAPDGSGCAVSVSTPGNSGETPEAEAGPDGGGNPKGSV